MTGRKHIDEEAVAVRFRRSCSGEPVRRAAPSGAVRPTLAKLLPIGPAASRRLPTRWPPWRSNGTNTSIICSVSTAEFDKLRKRVRRDTEELRLRAAEGVVESLLPVMDNMQRALRPRRARRRTADPGRRAGLWAAVSVMASHGLEQVQTEVGAPFDPTVHEAVLTQPSDEFEEGSIARVLEPAICCTDVSCGRPR